MIGELRALKPDLYINLTTGTYPSPFWLRYADSIWRGGEDHEFPGVGTNREQWITYRDADTYEHVVLAGPLYPAEFAHAARHHLREARQEPRTPTRGTISRTRCATTSAPARSCRRCTSLRRCCRGRTGTPWPRRQAGRATNADVLVDTHWIGGDPAQLEVYGWASWTPRKAILVLRNPSDKPQTINLDIAKAFELPADAARTYQMRSPWKEDRGLESLRVAAGQPHTFSLKPFEVLVLEGTALR